MSLKLQLITAARDLYLKEGLQGISMRKLAALCDITAPAIYKHFQDKDSLIAAIIEEGFHHLEKEMQLALRGRTAASRLKKTGLAYRDFALKQPAFYQLIFMSTAQDHGLAQVAHSAKQQLSPSFQFLLMRITECLAEKHHAKSNSTVKQADALEAAARAWSFWHGMVALYLVNLYAPVIKTRDEFEVFFERAWEHYLGQWMKE